MSKRIIVNSYEDSRPVLYPLLHLAMAEGTTLLITDNRAVKLLSPEAMNQFQFLDVYVLYFTPTDSAIALTAYEENTYDTIIFDTAGVPPTTADYFISILSGTSSVDRNIKDLASMYTCDADLTVGINIQKKDIKVANLFVTPRVQAYLHTVQESRHFAVISDKAHCAIVCKLFSKIFEIDINKLTIFFTKGVQ